MRERKGKVADLQRPLEKEEHQLEGDAGSVTSGEGAGLVTRPHLAEQPAEPPSPDSALSFFLSYFLC